MTKQQQCTPTNHSPGAAASSDLLHIVRRLLGEGGCPWDRQQSPQSMVPHLVEECFEVVEAIDELDQDPRHLQEELGDLLFQVVFLAELARLDLGAITSGICQKLVRRHPHVFDADTSDDKSVEQIRQSWEAIKQQERGGAPRGPLEGVPTALPPLERAEALLARVERLGFCWPEPALAQVKVEEELQELKQATAADDQPAMLQELGDLLLASISWGRTLGLDAAQALRGACRDFTRRFEQLHHGATQAGRTLDQFSIKELQNGWRKAKLE